MIQTSPQCRPAGQAGSQARKPQQQTLAQKTAGANRADLAAMMEELQKGPRTAEQLGKITGMSGTRANGMMLRARRSGATTAIFNGRAPGRRTGLWALEPMPLPSALDIIIALLREKARTTQELALARDCEAAGTAAGVSSTIGAAIRHNRIKVHRDDDGRWHLEE